MKTERRHELHTNWLADRLGEAAETSKPYAKGVVGVLVATVVLIAAYEYLSWRSTAESVAGWNDVWSALENRSQSEQMDALRKVVDNYPSTPAGIWAQLRLADDDLELGVRMLVEERSVGMNHLHSALKDYQSVEQKTTDPLIRQRALFGVARAQESLDQLDAARKAYEALAKDYPDGSYAPRAKERLDDLGRRSTQEFYDWLKTAESPSRVFGKGTQTPGSEKSGMSEEELDKLISGSKSPGAKTSSVPPPEPKPDNGKATPDGTKSGQKKPDDAKQGGTKSGDAKSGDAKSSDSKSSGTKSDPAKSEKADTSAKKPDATK